MQVGSVQDFSIHNAHPDEAVRFQEEDARFSNTVP